MSEQMIFERYEIKYLLTGRQKREILEAMQPYMVPDRYAHGTIRNIYFDTDTYRLIRRSIERPAYKEKLRLRSYRSCGPEEPVFVELKKKYRSVVYKRRLILEQQKAVECLMRGKKLPLHSQIAEEISYFCSYYHNLSPAVFLSYDRDAYSAVDGSDLRITFDENILARREGFSFDEGIYGTPLIDRKMTLMEVKTSGGIPLWLVHWLTRNQIYKTSFSKYGMAYQTMIYEKEQGDILHA